MIRLVAVLLFLPLVFIGQQDFGLWTKANFDYKFNKKFSLTSKTELRSEENARERSQFYSRPYSLPPPPAARGRCYSVGLTAEAVRNRQRLQQAVFYLLLG